MSASASERIASRYAEIFVSVFGRIIGNPAAPVVSPASAPPSSVDGIPFHGSNAVLAAMVAAEKGYRIPSWMTVRRANDLGLRIRSGERGIPVVHYDFYYESAATGRRDPAMDDARYSALSDEEKKEWTKRCHVRCYAEFNVQQTDFDEVYPEQWARLEAEFGPAPVRAECPALDAAIEGEAWLCPVVASEKYAKMAYIEKEDIIRVPPKGDYLDERRYYGDLSYVLARSTGSEGRLDRNISCPELSGAAREELVSELAGATVATLAGAQSTLQDHNLQNLKAWICAMRENPEVIYRAVNDASKAADLVSGTLGLEQRPGFSLQRVLDGVEAARKAREESLARREARARAATGRHRRDWDPVKTAKTRGRKV